MASEEYDAAARAAAVQAADREAAKAAAIAANVFITIKGERFLLDPEPPQWALLELGKAGALELGGASEEELVESLGAVHDFYKSVLAAHEWNRFRRFAMARKLQLADLMDSLNEAVVLVFGRPTQPSSPSEPSPSTNGESSTVDSGSLGATVPVF